MAVLLAVNAVAATVATFLLGRLSGGIGDLRVELTRNTEALGENSRITADAAEDAKRAAAAGRSMHAVLNEARRSGPGVGETGRWKAFGGE